MNKIINRMKFHLRELVKTSNDLFCSVKQKRSDPDAYSNQIANGLDIVQHVSVYVYQIYIYVAVTGRKRTLFLSILYHFSEFTMPLLGHLRPRKGQI